MTRIRKSVSDYNKTHNLAQKLTTAVNSCYFQQSENPEAQIAWHFKNLGFRHTIDDVKVREAYTPLMRKGWVVSIKVDSHLESAGPIEPTLPAAEVDALVKLLKQALTGVTTGEQDRVDDAISTLCTQAPSLAACVSRLCLLSRAAVVERCPYFVFAKLRAAHSRLAERHTARIAASSYSANDYSRVRLPHPILWLLGAPAKGGSKLKGISFGLYLAPADTSCQELAEKRTAFLLQFHQYLAEHTKLLTLPDGRLCLPDNIDSCEAAVELIRSALNKLSATTTAQIKAKEEEERERETPITPSSDSPLTTALSHDITDLYHTLLQSKAFSCRLALKDIGHSFRAAEAQYSIEDDKGRSCNELTHLLESLCNDETLKLGYISDCYNESDGKGWGQAMYTLYAKHSVAVCATVRSEEMVQELAEGGGCAGFVLDPAKHTVTSLARQACLSGVRCVSVTDSHIIALGCGAHFFTAPPLPAEEWDGLLTACRYLASSGALLPSAPFPRKLKLPQTNTTTDSVPQRKASLGKKGKGK